MARESLRQGRKNPSTAHNLVVATILSTTWVDAPRLPITLGEEITCPRGWVYRWCENDGYRGFEVAAEPPGPERGVRR